MDNAMQQGLASYLLEHDRMVVDPAEVMPHFPIQTAGGDESAWLQVVARLLGDAVELRKARTPAGKPALVVKDRAILFNMTQDRTLEDMAAERKRRQDA